VVLDVLAALECDVAQGFLLSRPLPAAEFDGWLAARA
jgi:EAL domain-containing protein (putative c-di-GMP-specific phosphodiesterase class I)